MMRSSALSLALLLSACPTGGPGGDDDDLGSLDEVEVGALVITEILARPNSGRPEYIELVSTGEDPVRLFGCQIVDGGTSPNEYTITVDTDIEPGERLLFGAAEFLGADEGELETVASWGSEITLNQGDPTESVGISCPDGAGARQLIDEVAFDWSGLGIAQGRSWQLVAAPDATTNDDPANWCAAPAQDDAIYATVEDEPDYGTPGAETVCETLFGERPSAPGDVVISEILVDDFATTREWFELHNPGTEPLDLRGCTLNDAPLAGGDPATHTLDAEVGDTGIPAGGYLLLAKSSTAVTPGDKVHQAVAADYAYSSLGFNNSADQRLWIECPVGDNLVLIDEIAYDWGDFGSDFKGRSIALDPGALTDLANDDPANWCLAGDDQLFYTYDDEGDLFNSWGTPGLANPPCPVPDPPPAAGDLVFTEILVKSAIGQFEEWVELKSVAGTRVGLDGCRFRNVNADGSDGEYTIESPLGVPVDPGQYVVFANNSADESLACGLPALANYGATSMRFSDAAEETVELWCPSPAGDVLVDSIAFDGGFESGIPWQLSADSETAAANDDGANWCHDAVTAAWTWSCTVDLGTNYGTPGGPSTCP